MSNYTKEQLEKLPKWAQSEINSLEMYRKNLEQRIKNLKSVSGNYNISVLKLINGTHEYIYSLEQSLLKFLRMYHLSVEDIKDMDIQQQEKALAEIQNRLLDNNSSIHSDNPISTDSKKSVLPLSSADQMWLELSSDCSEEEKEKMLKAATFTKNCLRHSDK